MVEVFTALRRLPLSAWARFKKLVVWSWKSITFDHWNTLSLIRLGLILSFFFAWGIAINLCVWLWYVTLHDKMEPASLLATAIGGWLGAAGLGPLTLAAIGYVVQYLKSGGGWRGGGIPPETPVAEVIETKLDEAAQATVTAQTRAD